MWVDTNDELVFLERFVDLGPERDELVLHTEFVVVKGTLHRHGLNRSVVDAKVDRLAVLDQRQTLIVLPVAVFIDRFAEAGQRLDWREVEKPIEPWADAVVLSLFDNLIGVEVREALSANLTREDILMSVDESVDAALAKLVDESVHAVEVLKIVLALLVLDCLPHDTEPDEVDTPGSEVIHVLLGERCVAVELFSIRQVWRDFVDHIDAVHEEMSTELVLETRVVDLDVLALRLVTTGQEQQCR